MTLVSDKSISRRSLVQVQPPLPFNCPALLDGLHDGSVTFLAAEGTNMLDAWIATGMAAPHPTAVSLPFLIGPLAHGDSQLRCV